MKNETLQEFDDTGKERWKSNIDVNSDSEFTFNKEKYEWNHSRSIRKHIFNPKKIKCLLRDFKKFYHDQLKVYNLSEEQDYCYFEEYVKASGISCINKTNSEDLYSNHFKISLYLLLIINPSLCFTNDKLINIIRHHRRLKKEINSLLIMNDVIFNLTMERLWKFIESRENRLL